EPVLIGLPILSALVGSAARGTRLLSGAYRDLSGRKILGKGVADFKKAIMRKDGKWSDYEETIEKNLRASGAPDDEVAIRMFQVLAKRGLFDRSSVNELTMMREPKPGRIGRMLDYLDESFRGLNTAVEALNRSVLALSAFRGEMAKSGDFDKAVRAAEDLV